MDSPYSNNTTSRVSKLQNFQGNVSPLNTQRDNHHHQFFIGGGGFHYPSTSPTFDPYTSQFDRYLRSASPASPGTGDGFRTPAVVIGVGGGGFGSSLTSPPLRAVGSLVETPPSRSPQVFNTPVEVEEEDVLVMDGIPVGGSGSGGRRRFSVSSSGSNSGAYKREMCRMRFPVPSDSSGGMSSSGSYSGAYKREICRSWEDSSYCRHGSKCQFAHGKEEFHLSRFLRKTKSEAQICKSYSGSGSCKYGAKCRFFHHNVIMASSPTERAVAAVKVAKTRSNSPFKPENLNYSISSSGSKTTSGGGGETIRSSITFPNTDWSPMDDGIMVSLPSSASANEIPSREAVDAYINSVLYGPPRGKRLPVFAEICPESPKGK